MGIFKRFISASTAVVAAFFLFASGPALSAQASGDCDNNAIIRCGVSSLTDLKQKYRENQAGNVQAIFQHFGISSEAAMDGMVAGRVTKSNEVYVGNELVATNAVTAGRQNMPGSTPILNGAAYQRPPSVSFRSSSLPALVKMENGQFKSAVIMSCGNPVKATPKPVPPQPQTPPNATIKKDVRISGHTAWQDSVRLDNAGTVEFRITVKNTGQVVLNNVIIGDRFPGGLSIIAGSVQVSGQAHTDQNALTQNGITIARPIQPNEEVVITFQATVPVPATARASLTSTQSSTNDDSTSTTTMNRRANNGRSDKSTTVRYSSNITGDQDCQSARYRNVAYVQVPNLPEREDDAVVEIEDCQDVPPPATPVGTPPTPPAPPTPSLPDTGVGPVIGVFSIVSMLGAVTYRLKSFYAGVLGK